MTASDTTTTKQSSRRTFMKTSTATAAGLTLEAFLSPVLGRTGMQGSSVAMADLPRGSAPKPVSVPHFPTRLHAFVWRNWPLVTLQRMAQVVRAKASDILRIGQAMGLGEPPRISSEQWARSYITIIKRNWHLLPYEQLLEVLDWTPERMAFALREDDFLYVKLGRLKPQCEPLRYQVPDERIRQREREIAEILRQEFPTAGQKPGEDLYAFVEDLSAMPAQFSRRRAPSDAGLRFCYSYFALYGDPLLEKHADPYPQGLLARLALSGVNGVWLQAVLHTLVPCPWLPQRSARYRERQENLRHLVERARTFGIRIFLYLNEPRAMPIGFFNDHARLKGVEDGDYAALCTSVPEVQQYLRNSVAAICRAVPDLGGFFSISASENLTNCWSHGGGDKCPRCRRRPPAEVIAEVNRLFYEGIRRSGSQARMIVWDWGWKDEWAGDAIQKLPAGTILQSVSEWSLPVERGGIRTTVGEYSISAIGPGPRAVRHWKIAQERGMKTIAKIQAGCTWELSAVPYIPAVENVARHAENLHRAGVSDLMLGWTLGGYPSPNLEVVAETLASGSAEEAMRKVAESRFGQALAPLMVTAWCGFSRAFCEFPYHGRTVYNAPQQVGPANLLWAEPTGYKATMVGFPYDDLGSWRAVYPAEIFLAQLEKVAGGFEHTLRRLRSDAEQIAATPEQRRVFERECGVAEVAAIHFRSSANQVRFVLARQMAADTKDVEAKANRLKEMKSVLQSEIALAKRLYEIQSGDSRIGFEATNQYYYVPADLMEKVLNCRNLLDRL